MPLTVRYNGTWRTVVPYARVGGVWRNAVIYVRVGGTWQVCGGVPQVSTDKTLVSGTCIRSSPGTCRATTDTVTVSVTGGTGNYTYLWELVSGETAGVNNSSSATTNFSRTKTVAPDGLTFDGLYRCKVTDTVTGLIAYSPNVTVRTTHTLIPNEN